MDNETTSTKPTKSTGNGKPWECPNVHCYRKGGGGDERKTEKSVKAKVVLGNVYSINSKLFERFNSE